MRCSRCVLLRVHATRCIRTRAHAALHTHTTVHQGAHGPRRMRPWACIHGCATLGTCTILGTFAILCVRDFWHMRESTVLAHAPLEMRGAPSEGHGSIPPARLSTRLVMDALIHDACLFGRECMVSLASHLFFCAQLFSSSTHYG